MLVILISCFTLAALTLLAAAAWTYFSQKGRVEGTPMAPILMGGLGIVSCLLALVILGVYAWGFSQF